jgi:hypothetical protein
VSTTEKLPVIVRPNGKVYRPRTLTAGAWENEYANDDYAGCFVFGTHDIDLARPVAEEECRFAFGVQHAINPELVWIRDAFEGGERRWVQDAVRGRAAVRFVASDDPEEESR